MDTRLLIGGLAVLAFSGGFTACGGGARTGASTGASPAYGRSRSELAARANAICSPALPMLAAIPLPSTVEPNAVEDAAYFDRFYAIFHRETKEIQAVVPAAAVASGWRSFVAAQVAADELLQTLRQKAHAKDPTVFLDRRKAPAAYRALADAATQIGATACGRGVR